MTPAQRLAGIRDDLRDTEADLLRLLSADRSRRRGELVRTLHEVRRMRDPDGYPYASQAGQDFVVDRLLRGRTGGVFVDVGAYDGVTGSNSLFFEQRRGWSGVLVEPVPTQRDKAQAIRRAPCLPYAVASGDGTAEFLEITEGYTQMSGLAGTYDSGVLDRVRADPRHKEFRILVETRSLARIFEEAGIEGADFVSLDIEGGEAAALSAFPFERFPVLVWAIENNTGSAALSEIMRGQGYELTEFCGPDEIWRKSDL